MGKAKGKVQNEKKGPATITNRRAFYDYEFSEQLEAGIALVGSEVKSLFHGRANLTDAYVRISNNELWLVAMDIEPYDKSSHFGHDRRRDRKLLMHRREINTLARKTMEKGLALIPTKVYFNHGKVKIEIGVGRGKRQYDKRESIKEKDQRREAARGRIDD